MRDALPQASPRGYHRWQGFSICARNRLSGAGQGQAAADTEGRPQRDHPYGDGLPSQRIGHAAPGPVLPAFHQSLLDRIVQNVGHDGLYIVAPAQDVVMLGPPFIISKDEIDLLVGVLEESIHAAVGRAGEA